MAWTTRDDLRFSVKFGLTKGLRLVRGLRQQLSDDERRRIADAIVEYLELANWKFELGPPVEPHGTTVHFGPTRRGPES